MKVRFNSVVKMTVAAAALACATGASAQSAGQLTAKFGFNQLTPKVESGDLSGPALPFTKASVDRDIQPVLIFAYGLTNNISAEVALGTPYKHKIKGAGSIQGTGELATVEALPAIALLQYRFFDPSATFRPYVGIGATYAYFMKERGSGKLTALTNPGGPATTLSIDNKFTYTAQVGLVTNLNERWFVDMTVNKTRLRTVANFSTGQTQDMKLDPVSVILAVGYKF
ncbi:OmpW/AlkL family protein [Massilia sp.]|uniref:OmpW/AlkL family protein n=1 Tax=Massilia sp. TaxID=1882437 RepID=UPI0028AC456F|nr:OmpW family outer membrane protein [Massilia sp.]